MESEPFTSLSDINMIHRWLTNKGNVREAELFIIACNFALRIGDLLKMPERLQYYFNFESYARDMEINDVFTVSISGNTHVFWHG